MKFKTNIPVLLLATLFFVASNGIAVFEHICNTSNTRSFCVFSQPSCENEKPLSPCCEKMGFKKKDNCCTHTQIFSKLSIEGFTAKQLQLKSIEKQISFNFLPADFFQHNKQLFENYYSGLPPPDNISEIQSLLQPTLVGLQTFRC